MGIYARTAGTCLLVTEKFIITGDRDEKIRLTDRLKPFIIHDILLNHSSFISSLLMFKEDVLLSADGKGRICCWDIRQSSSSSLLRTLELGFCIRQLTCINQMLAVVQDDSNLIHIIADSWQVVKTLEIPHRVHVCNANLISTLSTLYQVDSNYDISLLYSGESNQDLLPRSIIAKKLFHQ